MKIRIKKNCGIALILFVFIISAALCLNSVKAISFMMLIGIGFPAIFNGIKKINMISFFGLIYPIMVITISTIVTGDLIRSFQRTYCCFLMLLVFVVKKYNLEYKKYFYISIWVITCITVMCFLMDIVGLIDVNQSNFIRDIIYKYNIGLMGKHESYYFYYSIFLYASPLMIFLFFKMINERNYIQAAIVFLGILASGERTPVFLTVVGFLIFIVMFQSDNINIKILIGIILFVSIMFIALLYGNQIWNSIYHVIFVKGESSNNVRWEHISSLISFYKEKPIALLVGSGMGSKFYTSAWGGKITSDIELSFFNLMRQMGIPLFILFCYFLVYPLKKCNMKSYEYISYIIYLIVAALNPYLFDSTAYLVYIYIYIETRYNC